MSDQPGSNADREPQSKRQKRGDGVEEAFGGPMYDEATARKILKEVVLVPADSDEEGEEPMIGFDPDDAALDNVYYIEVDDFAGDEITPMIYFALKGDAKMCRYLVSRGASTTKADDSHYYFPMQAAAATGHLDVCELLYENGAQNDVRRENESGPPFKRAPFHAAARSGRDEVVRWLVLHGALCADGSSETVEGDLIYPDTSHFPESYRHRNILRDLISPSCRRLVEWAEEVTQSHSALVMFLLGTLPPAPDKDQSCALQCLSGHAGVRKHIADFVGLEVTKGKHLRILRQVVDVLPSFILRTEDEEW